MQVRLAFAVASHLEPEILIIDEVLSVGDAAFQQKSLNKMEEVTRTKGRTILFVSNNMEAVAALCRKCILLEKGRIKKMGDTREVIDAYLDIYKDKKAEFTVEVNDSEKPIQIKKIRVIDGQGRVNSMLEVGQPFKVEVTYQLKENLVNSYIGVAFIDLKTNIVLTDILDVDTNEQIYEQRPAGIYTSIFNFSNPIFKAFLKNSIAIFPLFKSIYVNPIFIKNLSK